MKLHNTLTRKTELFKPLHGNEVKLYACGLTVYSQPHIGNWVAYIYWDTLVRALRTHGYNVTHVQNITDVGHLTSDEDAGEDKMLKGALKEGITAWQVADKYSTIADHEAYEMLGLVRPTHMPKATDYIEQQIAFVEALEKKGFTYVIADGVYFDTSKLQDYGALAKLDIAGLQFGARVHDTGKKNPTDFAVWKFSDPSEKRDMEWDSPWGKGFPGWHLECSVMARELLGDQIDIHTGGIDHIPVHHTNEIAQTEAVTGKKFSGYWLHANHLKVEGTKISKSLGNGFTLQDIADKGFDLQAFKLMVLGKHYRTEGNFTWEILEASQNRLMGIREVADLRFQSNDAATMLDDDYFAVKQRAFLDTLFDDLDTPQALGIVSEVVSDLNRVGLHTQNAAAFESFLTLLDDTLGLGLAGSTDISDDQTKLFAERQTARNNQDWAKSDEMRDQLQQQGIGVRDTAYGQIWYRL